MGYRLTTVRLATLDRASSLRRLKIGRVRRTSIASLLMTYAPTGDIALLPHHEPTPPPRLPLRCVSYGGGQARLGRTRTDPASAEVRSVCGRRDVTYVTEEPDPAPVRRITAQVHISYKTLGHEQFTTMEP
ncbi:MAG: hypothetical protein AMXMBFR53_08580 [Gemmatimonadota bacterium]